MQAMAHRVMLALRLTQLAEQSRRAAILEKRNRMARDIHDTLAQGFTGVIARWGNLRSRASRKQVSKTHQ
jgi:signal transduction histidine kinase